MTCSSVSVVDPSSSDLKASLAVLLFHCDLQTVDATMPFFESELIMMHHTIATTLLFILDIDAIYGIGGECFLHVLASGASVLTADQQRFIQFGIARQLRIILPAVPVGPFGPLGPVAPGDAVVPAEGGVVSRVHSPAPTPPSTPRHAP